jgi:hypothetical protein
VLIGHFVFILLDPDFGKSTVVMSGFRLYFLNRVVALQSFPELSFSNLQSHSFDSYFY